MENNKKKSIIPTIILTILSLLWIYPIILILLNSLKKESAITTTGVFELPLGEIWNYKLCSQRNTDGFPEIFLVQPCNLSYVSSTDPAVLLYVCMVYCPCKWSAFQDFILSVHI